MDHVAGLATQVADRIGRIRASVDELQRRSPSTEVRVSSAGGEVVVSVNQHGRLMSMQLAPGSTARFTCDDLESRINDTLRVAVDLAVAVCIGRSGRTVGGHQDILEESPPPDIGDTSDD